MKMKRRKAKRIRCIERKGKVNVKASN